MELSFDLGNSKTPLGHCLLYFKNPDEQILCTYIVILPISFEVSKYVPPFLMNQVDDIGNKDFSAFAFPPVPELVDGYSYVEMLAKTRNDDLIYGGILDIKDPSRAMSIVNESVQKYAEFYAQSIENNKSENTTSVDLEASEDMQGVLYGLLNESDKIKELTNLVVKLKFALDIDDISLIKETEDDIISLANHLPEVHNIERLIDVIKSSDLEANELANLYLKRSNHLVNEEYKDLSKVEEMIHQLEIQRDSS
ncbi:MAG: hypothetical protein MK357_03695 [SAR202 cluster bacterium]|nr:hypothetical protein [SAR202 cluster bacterium]